MRNENKNATIFTKEDAKKIDGNALANALYAMQDFAKGKGAKLSRKDYQPLYFFIEKMREALKEYDKQLKAVAPVEKVNESRAAVYAQLSNIFACLGKVNGFSVIQKRLDGAADTEIFLKAYKLLAKDKKQSTSNAHAAAVASLADARKALKDLSDKAKKAEKDAAQKAVDDCRKAVTDLEKVAGNAQTAENYTPEKAFANSFIFELSRIVKRQADTAKAVLAAERKQRNAGKRKAKAEGESKTKTADEKPAESK